MSCLRGLSVVAFWLWLCPVFLIAISGENTSMQGGYIQPVNLVETLQSAIKQGQHNIVVANDTGASLFVPLNPTQLTIAGTITFKHVLIQNTSLMQPPTVPLLGLQSLRAVKAGKLAAPNATRLFELDWLNLGQQSMLVFQDVTLVTSCETLQQYFRYFCSGNFSTVFKSNATHLVISSWKSTTVDASSLTITCLEPFLGNSSGPTCKYFTVSAPLELLDVFKKGNDYKQVMLSVVGNISVADDGDWPWTLPGVPLLTTYVIMGDPNGLSLINFNQRRDVLQLSNTSILVYVDIVIIGLTRGATVEQIPVPNVAWSVNAHYYANIPDAVLPFAPIIYGFNMTRQIGCDHLLYQHYWFTIRFISPTLALWGASMSQNSSFTTADAQSMYQVYSSGIRGAMIGSWLRCNLLPDDWKYTGLLALTNNALMPLPQVFGVRNVSGLVRRILYAQNQTTFNPDEYTMVFIANVSFANLDPALTWPVVVTKPSIWGRWAMDYIVVDFDNKPNLFELKANMVICNLTLMNLPTLNHGYRTWGLWTAPLWPFIYARASTARLTLKDMTLVLPQMEMDFMNWMWSATNTTQPGGVEVEHANDPNSPWVQLERDMSVSTLKGLTNMKLQQGAQTSLWQFHLIDGFGYETANITFMTHPPQPFNLTTVATTSTNQFVSTYNSTGAQTSDSSSNTITIIIATVVSVGGAFLILALVASAYWMKIRKQRAVLDGNVKEVAHSKQFSVLHNLPGKFPSRSIANRSYRPSVALSCQDPVPAEDSFVINILKNVEQAKGAFSDDEISITDLLGTGATSKVFLGTWRGLPIAMKVLPLLTGPHQVAVMHEVAILMSISHKNVVATYTYYVTTMPVLCEMAKHSDAHLTQLLHETRTTIQSEHRDEIQYALLVQEFCEGGTLKDAVDNKVFMLGLATEVEWPGLLKIALDVASALAHLHSHHIIHGDLTPMNIMLTKCPDESDKLPGAKVVDFGLSVFMSTSTTHVSDIMGGTMFYAAPELVLEGHLSPAADIYSLGIIMWELYHGPPPWRKRNCPPVFRASSLLSFSEECPGAYTDLCKQCLDEDPARRPTGVEVKEQLVAMMQYCAPDLHPRDYLE